MRDRNPERNLIPFSTVKIITDDDYTYGNFGFKDETGKIVVEPQYSSCGDYTYGLCPVAVQSDVHAPGSNPYDDLRWGYIDEKGKRVILCKYREAFSFNRYGIAVVRDEYDDNAYLIDRNGLTVFRKDNIDFSRWNNFQDRFFKFSIGKFTDTHFTVGVYDKKRREVFLEPVTGGIFEWSEDVIKVYTRGKNVNVIDSYPHYINSRREELYPGLVGKGFNIVEMPNELGYAIIGFYQWEEIGETPVSLYYEIDDKKYSCKTYYGVANLQGELVIPAEYDKITDNKDGSFVCVKDGQEKRIVL